MGHKPDFYGIHRPLEADMQAARGRGLLDHGRQQPLPLVANSAGALLSDSLLHRSEQIWPGHCAVGSPLRVT